jgi:ABC-type iron transport system FetAB ATPase subunit
MPRLSIAALTFLDHGPYDLVVEAGACVGVMGLSGAGKSLFLRAVADLDPHGGGAALDDAPAASMPAPRWRRRVGLLPATPVWWHPRVGDHFPPGDGTEGPGAADLGLPEDVMEWPVGRLSAGERQRLALLRLLARRPVCLLLDEPTANLDRGAAQKVEAAVAAYRERWRAPVLWVGHDPAQLERVAGRIVTLEPTGLRPGVLAQEPAAP